MSLWNVAAQIGQAVSPVPDSWINWIPGSSPWSTHTSVLGTLALYFVAVYGGQEWMADRKPYKLRDYFIVHNLLLSVVSFVLLCLMLEQVVPFWRARGFHDAICTADALNPKLETLYQINYYIKYYELLDTLFLVAKKKPIIFLHVYHHPATALLCYIQLNGEASVQWVPIVLNLAVHTVMYWYYYKAAANPGYQPWWKHYITTMQITQFFVDLFVVYYASLHGNALIKSWIDPAGSFTPPVDCTGSDFASLFGSALLTSYLVLFIQFYKKTYKQTVKAKKEKVKAYESRLATRDLAADKMVDMGVAS